MASYILTTPTKIPPDIEELQEAMQLSVRSKAQLAIDIPEEDAYLQKKQDQQRSIANLAAILSLLDVQICLEKDSEILAILTTEKENLNEILIQKQSGKKCSFKTAEKIAISQLQNQVSCLEKSVDKKFETILKTIENNQSTVKSWAEIAAQTNSKEQQQQKATPAAIKTAQKQPQKQTKKQIQKQELDSYQSKRLILQVKTEIWKSFNSYNLRNQINEAFYQQENITNPVIASVTRSRTGSSVVLTTMPNYNADFLLEKQQVWEEFFSQNIRLVEKCTQWHKIVVHGVPIQPFSTSDGLSVLRNEIEIFNPDLKLLRDPNWLCSEENRQTKRHASIVFAVADEEQAQKATQRKLYIAGSQLIAESYKSAKFKTQCQKCQKFGHSTKDCFSKECCQICAEKHYTRQHKCQICQTIGVECPHAKLKCRNCGENHRANSQLCSFWKPEESNILASPAKSAISDIAMENSSTFAVVIPNAVW
jgi:hypothetical protein